MNKLPVTLLLLLLSTVSTAQTKPNILWVTIEDTSPQFIGCYGNKDARTPVIDKLANEGVRFTNAFSTGTVCSPSRSTLITGVRSYKMGTGNHRSNYTIPDFIHGFPYYLKKEGYSVTNNSKTDYNINNPERFISDAWDESSTKAGWWNRKPGQPFFAVFNYMDSHQSRTMTLPYQEYIKKVLDELRDSDRINESSFSMPPFYHDSPEMRKQFARVYNALKLTDNKIGELLKRLEKDHLRDSTIIFFFADHGEGIPRGKTNGINLGYRVPFVIWLPPIYKQLSPWGDGVITDELVDFEDLAPTIISLIGGNEPEYLKGRILMGSHRSKPTDHLLLSSDRSDNGIDMVRSITNGRYMYSRNYMPFMPEARYIRYMEVADIKQQMRQDLAENKLNELQKSLFANRPAEFLFDIEKDNWETNNLVSDGKIKPVLNKMRKQLDEEIIKSRDAMFLPEYEIRKISKKSNAYTYRLSDKNYPIKTIYEAASLSGFRGKDIALKQVRLLKSNNQIVRFWAITGLRSQTSQVLALFRRDIIDAMKDNYPPVVVTASAISYQEFKNEFAEENLKKYTSSDNIDLALMSINYLLYVKEKEPFINTIKSVHDIAGRNYDVKAACLDFLGSLGLVPNTLNFEE
jgi:arylsulfatase A-like enzyme